MRYDVAGALAQKSRFMVYGESKSLKFASELSKSLHFESDIHSVDSNIFGKCLRVQSREGVDLDFYPEKDLVVVSSSDFSASFKPGDAKNHMFVAVKTAEGLYTKTIDSQLTSDSCSVETGFWATDTLEYINSQRAKVGGRVHLDFETDKAASAYADKTVGQLHDVDYDSSDFGEHITKHETAEATEKARLDSLFGSNGFDSISGYAEDLHILPDEGKEYVEEGALTADSAARIATTAINNPEVVIADIKGSFTAQSGYTV